MDILHDCLDAGIAVGRGIWIVVIRFLVRCRWVGWGGCLMLDGGRREIEVPRSVYNWVLRKEDVG